MSNMLSARAVWLVMIVASVPCFAQTSAADNYKAKCQMCHAADGSGNTPAGKSMKVQPFNAPATIKMSDEDMFAIIKNGKGKMPGYASKLTDAEIKDLVEYIRTLQKK